MNGKVLIENTYPGSKEIRDELTVGTGAGVYILQFCDENGNCETKRLKVL